MTRGRFTLALYVLQSQQSTNAISGRVQMSRARTQVPGERIAYAESLWRH